jgi:hypothetical protein
MRYTDERYIHWGLKAPTGGAYKTQFILAGASQSERGSTPYVRPEGGPRKDALQKFETTKTMLVRVVIYVLFVVHGSTAQNGSLTVPLAG